MAWYKTGTVSVTNGSATVTGSGTSWFGALQVGWGFVGPDGRTYEITAVASATSLTLASAYQGATASGQTYSAFPTISLKNDLATSIETLISGFQSVKDNAGTGKFALGSLSAPGLRGITDTDSGFDLTASNKPAMIGGGVAQIAATGGVASGAAVQSSTTDATAGKLLKTGAFGLGGAAISLTAVDDLNLITASGIYFNPSAGNTTGNNYPVSSAGALIHTYRSATNQAQLYIIYSDVPLQYWRAYGPSGWSPWQQAVSLTATNGIDIPGSEFTLGGNKLSATELTVVDDAVGTFTPPRKGGFMFITADGDSNYPVHTASGLFFYDVGLSTLGQINTGWSTLGNSLNVVTTDVTGTTGTDGEATIAMRNGPIKFENRTGTTITWSITTL